MLQFEDIFGIAIAGQIDAASAPLLSGPHLIPPQKFPRPIYKSQLNSNRTSKLENVIRRRSQSPPSPLRRRHESPQSSPRRSARNPLHGRRKRFRNANPTYRHRSLLGRNLDPSRSRAQDAQHAQHCDAHCPQPFS